MLNHVSKLALVAVAAVSLAAPALAAPKATMHQMTMKPAVKTAALQTCTLQVSGMMCSDCVKEVTQKLSKVKGVNHVDVSLAKGTAVVSSHGPLQLAALNAALKGSHFKLTMGKVMAKGAMKHGMAMKGDAKMMKMEKKPAAKG
ncbi:MAG TPA: heavy metal-associated domain-containing protein [Oscillatoriaceae cyanobacterium]